MWNWLQPLATAMDEVRFTPDEMAILIGLKAADLFNQVAVLDEIHNGTLALFGLYNQSRTELTAELPIPTMSGMVGTIAIPEHEAARLAPKFASINELTGNLRSRCAMDAGDARRALFDVHAKLMEENLITFALHLKDRKRPTT